MAARMAASEDESESEDAGSSVGSWSDIGYNIFSCVHETEETEAPHLKPTEIQNVHQLAYCNTQAARRSHHPSFGMWLVFKDLDEIDDTWKTIRTAIEQGDLGGCYVAHSSTMRYNPSTHGPGPCTFGVVYPFTDQHIIDDVGFKLIQIVKQDIRYKTNEATSRYQYTHAGSGKTTIKTIFWNNGRPSFECEGQLCPGTSSHKEDIWHRDVVIAPGDMSVEIEHGRWVLILDNKGLTKYWHFLKEIIESKNNFGIIRMVCSPKCVRNSPTEKPLFHVYTSKERRRAVGMELIQLIGRDVVYEFTPTPPDMRETLYWNNGEPSNEQALAPFLSRVSEQEQECQLNRYETEKSRVHLCPSSIKSKHALYITNKGLEAAAMGLSPGEEVPTFGKWLLHKHYDEIDETWKKIRTAIKDNTLEGCFKAKCSTLRYNPTKSGPGPQTTGVICVYTQEQNMDDVGFKLIQIVEQDLQYKTNEASSNYQFTHSGSGETTIKTIFWNKGDPSFECEDRPCSGMSFKKEDIWHLNVVIAPGDMSMEIENGRWVLILKYEELTKLWHYLKKIIESKNNFGIIRMVCPPKHDRNSPTEKPLFHVYTSKERRRAVGMELIQLIERDIVYEQHHEILYWNDGRPSYHVGQ